VLIVESPLACQKASSVERSFRAGGSAERIDVTAEEEEEEEEGCAAVDEGGAAWSS